MSAAGRTAKTVHQAIAGVIRDVRAVAKTGRNDEDGYTFRTIDDVMTALNPVLAKHGVMVAPKVLTHHAIERDMTGDGRSTRRLVELEVRFRIYGPAGDHVDVTTWGEGLDFADKATSKAHTAALKAALLPAFMIPTTSLSVDGDASTPAAAADAAHRRIVAAERAGILPAAVDKLDGDVEGRRARSLRAEVLAIADHETDPLVRLEQLEDVRDRAKALGVVDESVLLPEPWQQLGATLVSLDELISGASNVDLPPTGETGKAAAPVDPWDVDPATRTEATS